MKNKVKKLLLLIATSLGAGVCLAYLLCSFSSYRKLRIEQAHQRQMVLKVQSRLDSVYAVTSLEKEVAKIKYEALKSKPNDTGDAYEQVKRACLHLDSLFGFEVIRVLTSAVLIRDEGYNHRYRLDFEDGSNYEYLRFNNLGREEIKTGIKVRHIIAFFPVYDAELGIYVPMKLESFKTPINGDWCSF